MFFAYLRQTDADWWLNMNPKRFAGPIPTSQIRVLSIDCMFVCSSFYSRELITRLRRYLSPLITALQYLGIQHRFTMELPHAWIEVKVSQRHNIILGLDLQSAYRQTDSFIMYDLWNFWSSFLNIIQWLLAQIDITDPLAFISVYNTSNKKI